MGSDVNVIMVDEFYKDCRNVERYVKEVFFFVVICKRFVDLIVLKDFFLLFVSINLWFDDYEKYIDNFCCVNFYLL